MEKLLSHRKPQGFTLVELLVYIAVSTVALMVFVTFMVDVSRSAARARTVQELHQNAQFVLDRIGQEVRSSQAVNVAGSTFGADAGTLALTTVSGTRTFSLASGAVTFNAGSGAATLTAPSVRVTMLRLTDASPAVTVRLHVEENNPNLPVAGRQALDLQTTIVPRQAVYQ